MKRLVCLLLVVSIAYSGCADKKQSKVTVVPIRDITQGEWDTIAELRSENVRLKFELSKAREIHSPEFLLARIDALEEDVLHKIYELGYATTSQRKALESAEVAIEAQRVTIEVLQKLCRSYEDVLGSQRATIEILKKMCRLYEDEVEG
ncbi:MAG TPA: hypothetical protein VMW72_06035 [Sedimentisphaerales bacterium]|nr:hypothetical protein [Sedimentisphaerales bacterium]